MKVACTFRIDTDVLRGIVAEAARLTQSEGKKISQADVIERLWCERHMLPAIHVSTRELKISGTETAHISTVDAVGPRVSDGRGKASVETWRAGRKPILKPSQRK